MFRDQIKWNKNLISKIQLIHSNNSHGTEDGAKTYSHNQYNVIMNGHVDQLQVNRQDRPWFKAINSLVTQTILSLPTSCLTNPFRQITAQQRHSHMNDTIAKTKGFELALS